MKHSIGYNKILNTFYKIPYILMLKLPNDNSRMSLNSTVS